MKATQVLRDEHEGILAMLAVVETAAKRLESGKEIPSDMMTNAVGFFRNFADKCHHGKEEDELFPTLERYGIPKQGGPIGVMLAEHDQGRAFVRSMGDAADKYARGDKTAAPALAQSTLGYVNLLRQHIAKENNVFSQWRIKFSPTRSRTNSAPRLRLSRKRGPVPANMNATMR